jgi:uncharacterized membrane protein YcjF (UPF0283 family)
MKKSETTTTNTKKRSTKKPEEQITETITEVLKPVEADIETVDTEVLEPVENEFTESSDDKEGGNEFKKSADENNAQARKEETSEPLEESAYAQAIRYAKKKKVRFGPIILGLIAFAFAGTLGAGIVLEELNLRIEDEYLGFIVVALCLIVGTVFILSAIASAIHGIRNKKVTDCG